jgi:uncharacterized protein YjbJ (UPF0337 family)
MNEDAIIGTGKDALGKVKDGVGGLTGDTNTQTDDKLDQAAGKAQEVFRNASEGLSDSVGALTSKASELAGHAEEKFLDATSSAKEIVRDLTERALHFSGRAGHYVEETVEKKPFFSLVGLAAIAYVTAYLIHSPSSPFAPKPRKFLR